MNDFLGLHSQPLLAVSSPALTLSARDNWLWVAGAILGVALILLLWSAWRSPLRGWRRQVAMHSKLLIFALLALLLLEPQSVTEVPRKGANDLALLADNSASLGIEPTAGQGAIGAPMREVWKDEALAKHLQETFRVQRYEFDSRLQEAPSGEAGLKFNGEGSALFTSLDSLLRRYQHRPLAAAVVFTDGNATDAAQLEKLMQQKTPGPIYVVASGLKDPAYDLALSRVEVTQTPFEDSPVALTASVAIQKGSGEELALVVRDEAKKVVLTLKGKPDGKAQTHAFFGRFRPLAKGVSFYTATVLRSSELPLLDKPAELSAAEKEVTLQNNQRVFAVDRKTGPYRVLYVSGRPNWEYKFLRRALEGDDEVKLVSLIRIAKREPKFEWRGRSGEQSNPLFRGFRSETPEEAQRYDQPVLQRLGIADKEELASGFPSLPEDLFGAYRCIILDDLEAEFFSRAQMDLLERYVSLRGGSLLMLGGQESLQQGGYANTPVSRLLPVYLDRGAKAQPISEARFKLTREGWLEPWMRLRQQEPEEQARETNMPSFFAVNAASSIKPGASVLATISDAGHGEVPAWITHRFGAGRASVVAVGDLWRWAMRNAESHADFDKAWRQLMRHLVVDVPDRAELTLAPDEDGGHDRKRLQVRVRDRAFVPQDDANVALSLTGPDGKKMDIPVSQSLTEAGLFEGIVAGSSAGAYRAQAIVKDPEGAVVGEPIVGWANNPLSDELATLPINQPLLEKVASWSGGEVISLENVASLWDRLPKLSAPITERRTEPFWHAPWVWVLLAGLLCMEWWLRRRAA